MCRWQRRRRERKKRVADSSGFMSQCEINSPQPLRLNTFLLSYRCQNKQKRRKQTLMFNTSPSISFCAHEVLLALSAPACQALRRHMLIRLWRMSENKEKWKEIRKGDKEGKIFPFSSTPACFLCQQKHLSIFLIFSRFSFVSDCWTTHTIYDRPMMIKATRADFFPTKTQTSLKLL